MFDPTKTYLTYHSYGDLDHALFIGNGSTTWYRCDTNLAPDSQLVGPVWSPAATIAGGFQALMSIETAPGLKQLLIGPTGPGYVLARDSTFNIFSDGGAVGTGIGGSPYEAFFTIGAIVLANPGQMAKTEFLEFDIKKVGTQPTVSVLFNELDSPATQSEYEVVSNSFITDPPRLYGPTGVATSMFMPRFYFGQTTPENFGEEIPVPAWCKFLNIKVDFGNTDTVQNEVLSFTIFGSLWQES